MTLLRHRNAAVLLHLELRRRRVTGRIERMKLLAVIDVVRRRAPSLTTDVVVQLAADAICARQRADWLAVLIGPGPQELTHPDDTATIEDWGHAG